MFTTLLDLPSNAIYALVNPRYKKVYVSHTTRLGFRLGELAYLMHSGQWKYPDMSQEKYELELVILETNVSDDSKYFVQYFLGEYRKQGYSIYNETEKLPQGYKFQIQYSIVEGSLQPRRVEKPGVTVVALNTKYEKEILGRFRTHLEAQKFLDEVILENNPAGSLVYKI